MAASAVASFEALLMSYNPLVYWKMNENYGTANGGSMVDASGNGRNGTYVAEIYGNPTLRPGLSGLSVSNFSQNSKMSIAHASWMDQSALTALVFWKPGTASGLQTIMAVDENGNTADISWRVRANGSDIGGFYNGDAVGVNWSNANGGTLVDASGNSRNGIYKGYCAGAAGLTGDGNRAISVANGGRGVVADASWMDATSFTIVGTVTPTGVSGTQTIVARYDGFSSGNFNGSSFTMRLNGNKLECHIFVGNTAGAATGTTTLVAGTTYDVAATYDGTTVKVYVNGVLDASATRSGMNNASMALTIGATTTGSEFFGGVVDDVAYIGSVLTQTQLGTLRTTRLAGSGYPAAILGHSPLAYYRLADEPTPVGFAANDTLMVGYSLSSGAGNERLFINGVRVDSATGVTPPVKNGALRVQALSGTAETAVGPFQHFALIGSQLSDADMAALYAASAA